MRNKTKPVWGMLFALMSAMSAMSAMSGGVLAGELALIDAHIHYSHDAWLRLPPGQAVETLRAAGLKRVFVSSSSDEGTQMLYALAPELIVPVLRPYRKRGEIGTWMHDDTVVIMLVEKQDLGFGDRSWRYSMLVRDGVIEKMFIEPDLPGDPFEVSDADTMLGHVSPAAEAPASVTVFSREGCPFCVNAKGLLNDAGIDYDELVLNRDFAESTLRAVLVARRCRRFSSMAP